MVSSKIKDLHRRADNARHPVLRCLVCMLAAALLSGAAASGPAAAEEKPLVVIDPGHGGHDQGARGVGGSLEKDVTLRFARELEKELARDCRVALTRTGDYAPGAEKRASIANHREAALFLSIHSGGFFRTGPQFWGIYHYPGGEPRAAPSGSPGKSPLLPESLRWGQIQQQHAAASRDLAETLGRYLRACPQIPAVHTGEAGMLLLGGLNMPAVVVEAGYLTHPAGETRLNDPQFLAETARCIHLGIRAYLENR